MGVRAEFFRRPRGRLVARFKRLVFWPVGVKVKCRAEVPSAVDKSEFLGVSGCFIGRFKEFQEEFRGVWGVSGRRELYVRSFYLLFPLRGVLVSKIVLV